MSLELITALEALLICAAIGVSALRAKILNRSGFIAAIIVGWSIYMFGGWQWFVLLLVFYIFSAISTRYKLDVKKSTEIGQEKNGIRSWQNVLANGGVATVFAVLQLFLPSELFFVGFMGALSTAMADTLATEIGLTSPYEPRLITSLRKRVPAGTSGGVTSLGLLAGLLGVLIIWMSSILLGIWFSTSSGQTFLLVIILAGGLVGNLFDSLLGATIQGAHKCPVCDKITERSTHCGKAGTLVKGKRIVDNNVVNLLATIFGAATSIIVYSIFI